MSVACTINELTLLLHLLQNISTRRVQVQVVLTVGLFTRLRCVSVPCVVAPHRTAAHPVWTNFCSAIMPTLHWDDLL